MLGLSKDTTLRSLANIGGQVGDPLTKEESAQILSKFDSLITGVINNLKILDSSTPRAYASSGFLDKVLNSDLTT
jgi:hypothetical protein